MAFDAEEVALRARERITEVSTADVGFTEARLMSFIPDALQELGEAVSMSEEFRLLQAEFVGVPVQGLLSIFDMEAVEAEHDPARILFSSIERRPQFRESVDTGDAPLKLVRVPRRSAFYSSLTKVAGTVFYFVQGDQVIAFKGPNGKLPGQAQAYATEITMTANVVPTLAILESKKTLQPQLINLVADIALRSPRRPSKAGPEAAMAT